MTHVQEQPADNNMLGLCNCKMTPEQLQGMRNVCPQPTEDEIKQWNLEGDARKKARQRQFMQKVMYIAAVKGCALLIFTVALIIYKLLNA